MRIYGGEKGERPTITKGDWRTTANHFFEIKILMHVFVIILKADI